LDKYLNTVVEVSVTTLDTSDPVYKLITDNLQLVFC